MQHVKLPRDFSNWIIEQNRYTINRAYDNETTKSSSIKASKILTFSIDLALQSSLRLQIKAQEATLLSLMDGDTGFKSIQHQKETLLASMATLKEHMTALEAEMEPFHQAYRQYYQRLTLIETKTLSLHSSATLVQQQQEQLNSLQSKNAEWNNERLQCIRDITKNQSESCALFRQRSILVLHGLDTLVDYKLYKLHFDQYNKEVALKESQLESSK